MRPVFRNGRLVGYTMSITHLPDIGGIGFSATPSEIYEEGLRLPVCKLVKAGELNEELLEIIRANVRVAEQVIGDIMANITCTRSAGARWSSSWTSTASTILRHSRRRSAISRSARCAKSIREIPDGIYGNSIQIEGVDDADHARLQ